MGHGNVKWKEGGRLKLLILVDTRPEIIRLTAAINKTRKCFDVILAYVEHARRYLADIGLPKERTYVTGAPMVEVLRQNLTEIEAYDIHSRLGLEKGKCILLSVRREENIDTEKKFLAICSAINKMANQYNAPTRQPFIHAISVLEKGSKLLDLK